MADTEKQGEMVLHEEGMTAPTLAPPTTSATSLFVVLKQLHSGDGGKDKGTLLAISETNNMGKSTISSALRSIHPTSSTSLSDTDNTTQSQNLPADARSKGITVTLDNNSMWNEFFKCQTEMILTKQGRRMFPYCRFRLSGMEPFQSYLLAMDIVPVDKYRYKWIGKGWETNGKAETHISRLFVHPESPATGLHWMQYPVSFYRLKLTNNTLDQEDHIILHSMHRYLPRLHIIPADKATDNIQTNSPDVITLSFSQTEFFAVTAYQNLRITQLKIDYNPFAKGFREESANARLLKTKNGISTEETECEIKPSREATTLNNLKTLFMKRNAAVKVNKDQNIPSPANGEKSIVNGDAPIVDKDVKSLCSKKRPSPEAFSDFIKGAHVKVKRLSLENIQHNGGVLQTTTSCTSGKEEGMVMTSHPENVVMSKEETVIDDIHRCKSVDKNTTKTELLKTDESKTVLDAHKDDKITALSSDQKTPYLNENEKAKVTNFSLGTEVTPESKTKKTLPHKRPEPVPLPLLAQFLKQRKSKTTKPKPEAPSSSLDSEGATKPDLTPESSSALTSITTSVSHSDSQPACQLTSLSQTVSSPPTTEENSMAPLSSTLLSSSSSTVVSVVSTENHIPARLSPSPPTTDPVHVPNTTSPSKPESVSAAPDDISDMVHNADAVSVQGLDSTLRSLSEISSVAYSSTTTEVNTDFFAITPDVPTVIPFHSIFDVPSNTTHEIMLNQEITPQSQISEIESVSNCFLRSSKESYPELFSQDVPPHTLSTHDEPLSLPLHDPPSPVFSLPSPAPSSPDPFPPDLFCDRPVPPRKTLDSFPERLLDGSVRSSPDLFPGLFNDRPVPSRMTLDYFPEALLDGAVTQRESLPVNIDNLGNPEESLFCQGPDPPNDSQSVVSCKASETTISDNTIPEPIQSSHPPISKKSKTKHKKTGKMKQSEDDEVYEGPIPVPMQPSLEDVEGQLFVSFTTKAGLELHLGDDAKTEVTQTILENTNDESGNIEEKFEVLEKALLHDLKIMKHRQVIHPVLQEVGLKLNLLDLTLEIDLQYLGVQLPIPPPVLLSEGSSSSQVRFVSRTGKTTDFTKIKGWRDKFVGTRSNEGTSSIDAGQTNLSAFCSDMLDEYLASEGKLIDERADNLSHTDTTPIAYQLPTKSTSYVRTLDSVLKKQAPPSLPLQSIQSPPSNKLKPVSKTKEEKQSKKSLKAGTGKQLANTTKLVNNKEKTALSLNKPQEDKKAKNKRVSKGLHTPVQSAEKSVVKNPSVVASDETPVDESCRSIAASCSVGRNAGLPKTVVKLMDVEDGAVWEGKHRTYITEERAAIALAALVTAEGATKGSPEAIRIIKRRAPPCLNDFCRLGCVCASLVHLRRHHHCGKPQCMLGCSCLRRKVVALKTPKQEESRTEEPEPQGLSEEDKAKWRKKNKKRKAYVLSGPKAAPEPAKRVKKLWVQTSEDSGLEDLFSPPPPRPPSPKLLSQELQQELDNFFSPLKQTKVVDKNLNMIKDSMENRMTCARVRAFRWRTPCHDKPKMVDQHHISQVSTPDIEEGELVPLNLSGPMKRLEIISECKWASTESRNYVMRVVCEHMAQDRLRHPFWIGKYYIQPVSKTIQETEEGSIHTYKVNISQLQPMDKTKDEKVTQSESESKKPVEKSEVKGLPFLSRCSPAGLLKAEKKAPDAPGQIMVNGKSYPQAKLELGQMGALHPANRLAAYITGRICPASQSGSQTVPTATTTNTSTTSVPVTCVTTVTSVTNKSASTTMSSIKSVVTKPPVGKVFTQFVVNHINSQNLPRTSIPPHSQPPVPKIVVPSSLLMVGRQPETPEVAFSPLKADLATQVSKPSDTTGSFRFPTVSKVQPPGIAVLTKPPSLPLGGSNLTPNTVSSSGSDTPGKKTMTVVTVMNRNTGPPSGGLRFASPATPARPPQAASQKMLLQVVKTANGNTLYRNPSGQLVQLVPLSQIKALKPNLLSQGATTFIRLPTPNAAHKLQGSSTTIVPSSSPTTQTQKSTTITAPVSTSLPIGGKPVTLTSSKSVAFKSLPSTLKVAPGFLGQSGTCTLRILPQNTVKDSGIITPTSLPSLSPVAFTLLKPTSSSDSTNCETTVSVSSVLKEGPNSQVHASPDFSKQSEMVPATQKICDDSNVSDQTTENVFQPLSPAPTSPKSIQFSGEGSSPAHKVQGEPLSLVKADKGASTTDEVQDNMKEFDTAPDHEEEEIDSDVTELTDDSDLYSDDDDGGDACGFSDSNGEERTDDGLDSEFNSLPEKEKEELVDIETVEESAEKNITQLRASATRRNQHLNHQKNFCDDKEGKIKKLQQERERRSTLRDNFLKLQATLQKPSKDLKASKMTILTLAQKEIESLGKQDDKLVKKREKLRIKRESYIQTLSILSEKSTESISKRLNEITAKQKALDALSKAKETHHQLPKPPKPKPVDLSSQWEDLLMQDKGKDVSKPAQSAPNSNPIDLSIKKRKGLEKPESIIEGVSKSVPSASKPVHLDGSKNTPKTQDKEKSSVSEPTQPASSHLTPVKKPTAAPMIVKPPPMPRERMRPNILSRPPSQTMPVSPVKEPLVTNVCFPQVIPLVNSVVPCSQIITISNPLQSMGITSVGAQQSTTRGVASVSISLPGISHPLQVENPLPILQPQLIKITNSSVKINTPGESVNLPNIAKVISLVPPVESLVLPQKVVIEKKDCTSVVQTQPTCIPALVEEQQKPSKVSQLQVGEVDVPKQPVGGAEVRTSVPSSNQDELGGNNQDDGNDTDDENLMSLLDELVLLSQQLSNDPSEPLDEDLRMLEPGEVNSSTDKQADVDKDDERSLSPLFLSLDEDLISSNNSKDDVDDIPPKVDDLVKVIFGSESPSVSSESGVATSTNIPVPSCPIKNDAPIPPPLLHMKAVSGATSSHSANEQGSVLWRPMPKLVPLGLKAQDPVLSKTTGSSVQIGHKSAGSQPPDVIYQAMNQE